MLVNTALDFLSRGSAPFPHPRSFLFLNSLHFIFVELHLLRPARALFLIKLTNRTGGGKGLDVFSSSFSSFFFFFNFVNVRSFFV